MDCFLGDVPGVPGVSFSGNGVENVADDTESGVFADRINYSGRRVELKYHVALLDLLEAADARAVEAYTLGPDSPFRPIRIVYFACRDGEMLPQTGQIDEFQVDEFNVFIFDLFKDFFRCHFVGYQ